MVHAHSFPRFTKHKYFGLWFVGHEPWREQEFLWFVRQERWRRKIYEDYLLLFHMNFTEFKNSLKEKQPPASLSPYLEALWYDAKNNWDKAHTVVQDIEDKTAAWVHAYLHRKEGDVGNADYWYSRAGRKRPSFTLEQEWDSIVGELLLG